LQSIQSSIASDGRNATATHGRDSIDRRCCEKYRQFFAHFLQLQFWDVRNGVRRDSALNFDAVKRG